MAWLLDLDKTLRGGGCNVQEVGGWRTHGHGSMGTIKTIVIHHTAGASTGDYPSLNVVRNGRAGLPGPLAQLGVGRSGKVYLVSAGQSWHAGVVRHSSYANLHSIGLEVESVGTGPVWPEVQIDATAKAAAALCRRYGLPVSRVLGHAEICSPPGRKVDPVGIPGGMNAFRARVQRYLSGESLPTAPLNDDERLEAGMALSPEALKQIYNAVWHGVPGGKLVHNRLGNFGEWPETALGSVTDRIVRQNITPLRGEVAGLYKALEQLDTDGSVDIEAVRQAAKEGAAEALTENVVNVDVNVKGEVQ